MFKANDWFESLPREKQLYYLEHKSELIDKVSDLSYKSEQIRQVGTTVELLNYFVDQFNLKTIPSDILFQYIKNYSSVLGEQLPKLEKQLKEQLKND